MADTFKASELAKEADKLSNTTVENIDITAAANGYSVRVRKSNPKGSKSNEPVAYEEPETHVFRNAAELLEFVAEVLS